MSYPVRGSLFLVLIFIQKQLLDNLLLHFGSFKLL